MNPKSIGAVLLALTLISAQSAPAQQAQTPAAASSERKLELARELVAATAMDTTMVGVVRGMAARMTESAEGGQSPERQARMKIVSAAAGDALAKLVPKIMQSMVTGYAQTFTEQELSDMLAFYRSPSGRSMVSKQPQFMQGIMAELVGLMPEMRRDMGTEICAKIACTVAQKAAYFGSGPASPGPTPAAAPQPPAP